MMGNSMYDECKRAVYGIIVDTSGGRPVIRQNYRRMLDPYSGCQYPLTRVGILPRVTRKYMDSWIHVPALADSVCRQEDVMRYVQSLGLSRLGTVELVKDVLSRIGTESYTPEWTSEEASAQLDEVIESSTTITKPANNILARTLDSKVQEFFANAPRERPLVVMDVGVGVGNTIYPFLEMLGEMAKQGKVPHDYSDRLLVYLLDVSPFALEVTTRRLAQQMPALASSGSRGKGMQAISVNFADLGSSSFLASRKGTVDVIISGAAVCHQTDLLPFFEQMYGLLDDSGVMHLWDWYNGPSFAAPSLRLCRGRSRSRVFRIAGRDGGVKDIRIPDIDRLPEKLEDSLGDELRSSEGYTSVYEMTEDDAGIVIANFRTLLGILGYVYKDSDGTRNFRSVSMTDEESGRNRPVDIEKHLQDKFWEGVSRPEGFSYFDFLANTVPLLDNSAPFKPSAYYLIEGYGDNYSSVMRRAGFSQAEDNFFIQVYNKHKAAAGRPLTDAVPAYQIRFTFGKK